MYTGVVRILQDGHELVDWHPHTDHEGASTVCGKQVNLGYIKISGGATQRGHYHYQLHINKHPAALAVTKMHATTFITHAQQ